MPVERSGASPGQPHSAGAHSGSGVFL